MLKIHDVNKNITGREFWNAKTICKTVENILENRDTYLTNNNLPKHIYNPRNIASFGVCLHWGCDNHDIYRLSKQVMSGDYLTINNLRYYTQPFSGHDPQTFYTADQNMDWFLSYEMMCHEVPANLLLSAPNMLGEIGWWYNERLINYDVAGFNFRIAAMHQNGILDFLKERERVCVLEIGSGYGGFAYHFKKLFPCVEYYCVDIPESLLFAMIYLQTLSNEYSHNLYDGEIKVSDFTYIMNYHIDKLANDFKEKFDLIINCISLDEMSVDQISFYAERIDNFLKKDGIFYEQNGSDLSELFPTFTNDIIFPQFYHHHGLCQGIPRMRKKINKER